MYFFLSEIFAGTLQIAPASLARFNNRVPSTAGPRIRVPSAPQAWPPNKKKGCSITIILRTAILCL